MNEKRLSTVIGSWKFGLQLGAITKFLASTALLDKVYQ